MSLLSRFSQRGWYDADWKVRQRTALTNNDPEQLRRLALTDVSEEVRVTAVGRLEDNETLFEVVKVSACPRSRQLAASRISDPELRLALVFTHTLPEDVRIQALDRLPVDERLLGAYLPESPEAFKLALLNAVKDIVHDVFWTNVAQQDPSRAIRAAAIGRIQSEKALLKLYRNETDTELRFQLSDGVKSPEMLYQLLQTEDRESQRLWLVSRIQEPEILERIVRNDGNPHVQQAALIRIQDPARLVAIACDNVPAPLAAAALNRLHDDKSRGVVAMKSPHEAIRAEALRPITDEDVLTRLEEGALHPEIRWLAGRRNDSMPIKALGEIHHGPTLRRLIELEPEPDVATWLVGRVKDQETLRVIGGSTFPGVIAARRRLNERKGPLDLRFMTVPGRPYAMGVFPVTNKQLREALGPSATAKSGDDDLPATGIPPEVAIRFCEFLNEQGGGSYRLPSFEEWRHASLTDDENWLDAATGQNSRVDLLMGKQRVAYDGKGRRSAVLAWPNPWGFLDMIGNVVVWVDEAPRPWLYLASYDTLAVDGDPAYPSDFAVAAGVHWADTRVRKDGLERLVARSSLSGWTADKVGFRVVCDLDNAMPASTRYKVILNRETAPGYTQETVMTTLRYRSEETAGRLTTWYRVAPAVVLETPNYKDARQLKSLLESCGARIRLAIT